MVAFLKNFGFTIGGGLTLENLLIMPLISNHQFLYNSAQWFVVPLFTIQDFNILVRKLIIKLHLNLNEWAIFICSFIIGLSGIILVRHGYGHTIDWSLFLVRFMCYLPFFEFGILYNKNIENKVNISNILFFSVIFLIKLVIITNYGKQPVYGFGGEASQFDECIFVFYIVGALGILFWLRVSDILLPVIKDYKHHWKQHQCYHDTSIRWIHVSKNHIRYNL